MKWKRRLIYKKQNDHDKKYSWEDIWITNNEYVIDRYTLFLKNGKGN